MSTLISVTVTEIIAAVRRSTDGDNGDEDLDPAPPPPRVGIPSPNESGGTGSYKLSPPHPSGSEAQEQLQRDTLIDSKQIKVPFLFLPREKARLRVSGEANGVPAADSDQRLVKGLGGISPNIPGFDTE